MTGAAQKRHRAHVFIKMLVPAGGAVHRPDRRACRRRFFGWTTVYVIGHVGTFSPAGGDRLPGLYKGRNIFTVSEDEIAKNLEKDYSIIYQGMQIEYPSTIYLYVEERKPVAVMRWLGSQYVLDAKGMVMSESDSMDAARGDAVGHGLSRHGGARGADRFPCAARSRWTFTANCSASFPCRNMRIR